MNSIYYMYDLYNYFFPSRRYQRKRVRDFIHEPDDDLVYIHDWGYQEFPNPFTHCIFYTRKVCTRYDLITLYTYDGIEDGIPKECIEKIITTEKSKNPIYLRNLKCFLNR